MSRTYRGRGPALIIDHPGVDLVTDQPDTPFAAEIQDLLQHIVARHPARRIARRIDHDGPGAAIDGVEQAVKIEAPALVAVSLGPLTTIRASAAAKARWMYCEDF